MRPETWLPTSTVTTACRLPDVLTFETTLPRSICAVWYSGSESPPAVQRYRTSAARMSSATIQMRRARESCLSNGLSDLRERNGDSPHLLGNGDCPRFRSQV